MANSRKKNLFTQVPAPRVKRNLFDLSHEVKMSGKFGYLYPVLCMDTLPGDTIRDRMNIMLRFAPMLAPVMHRMDVTTHFFFVPYRLLWDEWEDFITGGQDGNAAPVPPYIVVNEMPTGLFLPGSLWDYLGLPTILPPGDAATSEVPISVLPFRACAKIWNDYYRDPNLDNEMEIGFANAGNVSDGEGTEQIMTLSNYRRGFEKDYFTSALPWAQRGPQVLMPLTGVAEGDDITYRDAVTLTDADFDGDVTVESNLLRVPTSLGATRNTPLENIQSINVDNVSTTINDFRRAIAIQRWLEVNARGGARYVEQIEGHFAVRVPDYRLQRAEYLGGGRQPVQISEVLQATGEDNVGVGDMYGHGLSVGSTNRFTYRCQEHGVVIGFLSVTMRTAYSQGIPKMWLRRDKFDFAFPELARLGEQAIQNMEVFWDIDSGGDDEANEGTFGYIPRYAEYKFMNDRIAGDFRTTLGFWHLGRKFTQRPSLDSAFTTIFEDGDGGSGTPDELEESFRRIFQVNDGTDYLWMQLYHHLTAKRPLPYFGVPSIV